MYPMIAFYDAVIVLLSCLGALGALQMLNLKALWTSHFSDPMLFLIGCAVLGCAQVFVVNWEPVILFINASLSILFTSGLKKFNVFWFCNAD